MRLVMILAALAGTADLLLLLPVTIGARYAAGVFSLTAKAGPLTVRLLPKKRMRRQAETADRQTKSLLRRVPGPVMRASVRRGLAALGCLRGRVRLTQMRLRFTAGGRDAYSAVMAYAGAGLVMEGVRALCAGRVGQTDLRTDADFDGPTALDAAAAVQIRLGFLLWSGIYFCFAFFREYYRYKRRKDDAEDGRTNGA